MKNIAFIINPMSGTQNKRRLPKQIVELLDKRQWLENIVFTERIGHARRLAAQYATMGFDAVVAVGGDGTVREVAEGLLGTHTAMGIIPMGLTNTMARHIGLPARGNGALAWLNRSEVLLCDCIEVSIDDATPLIGVSYLQAGPTAVLNCRRHDLPAARASIQDGLLEQVTGDGLTQFDAATLPYSGNVLIDGDEYTASRQIDVRVLPDSLYILAPKRL